MTAMLKFLRYAVTTRCFAASIGCLALWYRSLEHWDILNGPSYAVARRVLNLQSFAGTAQIMLLSEETSGRLAARSNGVWRRTTIVGEDLEEFPYGLPLIMRERGLFGQTSNLTYFPLWYAALVFALAGIGAFRFGCSFRLRSAIVVTTIVAGLLGLIVAL